MNLTSSLIFPLNFWTSEVRWSMQPWQIPCSLTRLTSLRWQKLGRMKIFRKQKLHSSFYKYTSGRQQRIRRSILTCTNIVSSGAPRRLRESFELVKQIHSTSALSRQAFMAFIEVDSNFMLAASAKAKKSVGL